MRASLQKFPFSPGRWQRNLRQLAREMAGPEQAPARRLAAELGACLGPARQAFARLCPDLCPVCHRPCCVRISRRGLLDIADLIFFAAQEVAELPYPRHSRLQGCPFLGEHGCNLPWRARPFACLHYVCGHLKRALSAEELRAVERSLERAAGLRTELVKSFTEGRR